jgi:hypothetical protein
VTDYFLRLYEPDGTYQDTRPDYPLEFAERDADWYANHERHPKVEIRRASDREVVKTVTPEVTP